MIIEENPEWTELGKIKIFDHLYTLSVANFSMSLSSNKFAVKLYSAQKSKPQMAYYNLNTYASNVLYKMRMKETNILSKEFLEEYIVIHQLYTDYMHTHNFDEFESYMDADGIVLGGRRLVRGVYEDFYLIFAKKGDDFVLSNHASKVFKRFLLSKKLLT